MNLTNSGVDVYVPDGVAESDALSRITHLGIGAHQDDLEFMAFHGILACLDRTDQWFGGVTCTNGAGSARAGVFADCTDEEMQALRRREQRQAADLGRYGVMVQLNFPSGRLKDPSDPAPVTDLVTLLRATRPEVVYTHNPADKHDTHVGVFAATLRALRSLPAALRPKRLLGCEVWRGLDWMMDQEKVALDVSGHPELAERINAVFASQIAGGKRYDLATLGRRRANATFFESHTVDALDAVWFAMDLTPLLADDAPAVTDYVTGFIDRFAQDVRDKLNRVGF